MQTLVGCDEVKSQSWRPIYTNVSIHKCELHDWTIFSMVMFEFEFFKLIHKGKNMKKYSRLYHLSGFCPESQPPPKAVSNPSLLHGNEWVTFHSTTDLHPSGHFSYCGQWVMLCFFYVLLCYIEVVSKLWVLHCGYIKLLMWEGGMCIGMSQNRLWHTEFCIDASKDKTKPTYWPYAGNKLSLWHCWGQFTPLPK